MRKVGNAEAREVIQAQSSDFAAYRQRLAAGVTTTADAGPARQATGSVQAKVDDRKQSGAQAPDKLTLSQGSLKASAPEAKISKESERKDTTSRVAELARNVDDLTRLKQSTGPGAPAAPAPAPTVAVVPPKAQPARADATEPAADGRLGTAAFAHRAGRRTERADPRVGPADGRGLGADPGTRAQAGRGGEADAGQGSDGRRRARFRQRLAREPDGAARRRRAGGPAGRIGHLPRAQPHAQGRRRNLLPRKPSAAGFLLRASGGQRIDTREGAGASSSAASSSMSYSLSQLDAIGDVDPVAEADVYLAYGRDLQAEEILKEAMRANPGRMAIRTKLLEVYAKRRDIKGFELLATQVFSLTKGEGEDWAKAQEMGQQIDPENTLYKPGGQPEPVRDAGGQEVEPLGASTMPHTASPPAPVFTPDPSLDAGSSDLDLDLDFAAPDGPGFNCRRNDAGAADRRCDADRARPRFRPRAAAEIRGTRAANPTVRPAAPSPAADDMLDFDLGDLNLDEPSPNTVPLGSKAAAAPEVDFGNFILPGDDTTITVAKPPAATAADEGDPLSRKLELAEEFRQIGDLEGARDLLEEVIAKADGTVRSKAQTMLNSLA